MSGIKFNGSIGATAFLDRADLPGHAWALYRPPLWNFSTPTVESTTSKENPMDEGRPVSYEALPIGAAVLSSTNTQFGTVEHVLQIPELDLFDGIAVKTKHGLRFVGRDQIADITTTLVRCALTDEEAAALPAPKGALVLHPDTAHDEGSSLTARFGRLFGREHWKELE